MKQILTFYLFIECGLFVFVGDIKFAVLAFKCLRRDIDCALIPSSDKKNNNNIVSNGLFLPKLFSGLKHSTRANAQAFLHAKIRAVREKIT